MVALGVLVIPREPPRDSRDQARGVEPPKQGPPKPVLKNLTPENVYTRKFQVTGQDITFFFCLLHHKLWR